uniref:Uncharacterized protein n=1 Tax=Nelumbo nucifera TaxID=4432 RepID=A0A822XW88_NELNU|nr:TPA_asm: hypothetical protein HUJ06_024884 [Nelumbo nucifera]
MEMGSVHSLIGAWSDDIMGRWCTKESGYMSNHVDVAKARSSLSKILALPCCPFV